MYGYTTKKDATANGSETAETPVLCETCLGPNPYVRMSKQAFGKECKICDRPFTVFKWNPGAGMRTKKTEVCTTCAKIKNVCQTCVLDLQYGLPVQVRDAALGLKAQAPSSEGNKQYFVNNMENSMGDAESLVTSSAGPSARAGQELLRKLARTDPGYRRNRPHLCSFYAKGQCNRGDECPFRHELPVDNDLSKQNIKDRFYGRNDPVAKKIMNKQMGQMGLAPPEDKEITSLFLTSLPPTATDASLRSHFLSSVPTLTSADIRSITLVPTSKCAFLNFRSREKAEEAASASTAQQLFEGQEIKVAWGRSRPKKGAAGGKPAATAAGPSAVGGTA